MSDGMVVYTEDRVDAEEALLLDPDSLDSSKYYRWVQSRPQNIAKKKAMGFQLVSKKSSGVKSLVDLERTVDDTIRFSDSVLMCCPKDRYLRRRSQKQTVIRDRLEATSQRFKEKVDRAAASGLNVKFTDSITDRGEMEDDE